jgi:hypothetical protein
MTVKIPTKMASIQAISGKKYHTLTTIISKPA